MNKEIYNQFKMITDKEKIESMIKLCSMFLLVFENLKKYTIDSVKDILCNFTVEDSKIVYYMSLEYKELINMKWNSKKNIFLSSMCWLKDNGAINEGEMELVKNLLTIRNDIAHELLKTIMEYDNKKLTFNFINLINIFKKIDRWYLNNYEIPISGEDIPNDYDENGVMSGNIIMLDILLDTIYGDNKYKDIFND